MVFVPDLVEDPGLVVVGGDDGAGLGVELASFEGPQQLRPPRQTRPDLPQLLAVCLAGLAGSLDDVLPNEGVREEVVGEGVEGTGPSPPVGRVRAREPLGRCHHLERETEIQWREDT